MPNQTLRPTLTGALWTAGSLVGGLIAGVAMGNVIFESLPGHVGESARVGASAVFAIAAMLGGGALWGARMGRLAHASEPRRMAWAGALGFAPITVILGATLGALEPVAVERLGAEFPIHRIFTFFFVPTAFLIAAAGSAALALGLRDRALAGRVAWRAGLAAALAFLVVNLAMEASGWVVGAPRAAERFTMLTVMFVGDLGAALAGGAVAGMMISQARERSEDLHRETVMGTASQVK